MDAYDYIFPQLCWTITDKIVRYLKCTCWFDICLHCERIPLIELVNTSITSHIYLCVCLWTHSSFTLLANCNYTIHLTTEGLYPFTRFSLFPSLPHPSNYFFFLLSVSMRLTLFLDSTYKWNETVRYFPSLSGLFHLTLCSPISITLLQ